MIKIPELKNLICNQQGSVLNVTLNRPEKLNAFDMDMFEGLRQVAEIVSNERDIRMVVFKGAGRAFSCGADLSGVMSRQNHAEIPVDANNDDDVIAQGMKNIQGVFDRVENIPKPTIASINGHAVGAGLQLALACDFRIASKGAKLGLTDVKIGIIPGLGGTTRLPLLIGLARAKEIIMTGDLISSQEAVNIGLVNQVVEGNDLDKAVQELTEKLISRAPLALAAAKDLLNTGASLDRVAKIQSNLIRSSDAIEGMTAFLEKRTPNFSGC
ncbi:MAG: enoyl-CoA hydratase/isomerase family protein [Spirochaetota bacterium]|nr:enoyl-CoA hydratase/isomerase family protein [Spirochaetota bacterium]